MLSRQHNLYQQLLQLTDGLLLAACIWLAHLIRYDAINDVSWIGDNRIEPQAQNYVWMILAALVVGPLTLEWVGLYQTQPALTAPQTLWKIARANLLVLLTIFTCIVVLRIPQVTVSRAALIGYFFLGTAVVFARSGLFYLWLRQRGAHLHLRKHILLCGAAPDRARWKERFLAQPAQDFAIRAEFDLRQEGVARFIEMLHEASVDIVVFSLEERVFPQVREALLACEAEGVEAWVSADFIQTLFTRVQFDQFAGEPLLIYRTTPAISWELVLKRVLDVTGSFVLLVVGAPLMLLIAILIRLDSPGPVFFSQSRSGLHGRPFSMHKFRTMVTNAEQARAELEDRNEMSGPVFKVQNDPRVTRLGRLLRRTSADELPQLWNVIRGEMSLVGPRPLPLYETANFGDISQRRRMSVRPGLTCLWQIEGRNRISNFKDWVQLDLEYIDRWSLWLDVQILLRTVPVVLFGWGAK
jgi:exopolysaccharide biosynthesis polyprenyl glycosylphosphotransferase